VSVAKVVLLFMTTPKKAEEKSCHDGLRGRLRSRSASQARSPSAGGNIECIWWQCGSCRKGDSCNAEHSPLAAAPVNLISGNQGNGPGTGQSRTKGRQRSRPRAKSATPGGGESSAPLGNGAGAQGTLAAVGVLRKTDTLLQSLRGG